MGTGLSRKRWVAVLSVMGMVALPVALGVGLIDIPTAHAKGGNGGGGQAAAGQVAAQVVAVAQAAAEVVAAVTAGAAPVVPARAAAEVMAVAPVQQFEFKLSLQFRRRRAEFRKPERQQIRQPVGIRRSRSGSRSSWTYRRG